jgi:short-subunit dehydrogenase
LFAFQGQWAVVTGSSYGIGRDFALELAARGLNIVLHGRSESRLKPVAKEIEQRFSGVRVRVITQDVVSDNGWDEAEKLLKELGNVAVLINNVGGGSLDAQVARLHERSKNYTDDVARMNFHSTVHWTRIFLANFVRHNQQAKNDASKMKEGRIITCSSLSHVWGYGESVYPASKSGLHAFTRIINNEYHNADNIRAEGKN